MKHVFGAYELPVDKMPTEMLLSKMNNKNMLISQLIALDKNYIQPMYGLSSPQTVRGERAIAWATREKIMRATKLIVPNEFMNLDGMSWPSTLIAKETKIADRHPLYVEYARVFSPTLFIENDFCGVLVEERINGWMITPLILDLRGDFYRGGGMLGPSSLIFDRTKSKESWCKELWKLVDGKPRLITPTIKEENMDIHDELIVQIATVCELLLFVNVKNAPTREYIPTHQENAGIPKALLPKYTYKILDIYRDLGVIDNLDTVRNFIRTEAIDAGHRRAHLVRGHFKRKKNGLFWWSPFMRARESATKLGAVVKNYNLKVKE